MEFGPYYNSTDKLVSDGDTVYADDLNSVNEAVESAFETLEADLTAGLISGAAASIAWASNAAGVRPDPDVNAFSSKAYAAEAQGWAVSETTVIGASTGLAIEGAISAKVSAASAVASAGTATTQAGIAVTKAGEALVSASNAASSESNALAYKNAAEAAVNNALVPSAIGANNFVGINADGDAVVGITKASISYSSTPTMNGTGTAGSATTFSKGDHVHPTDTSRAPISSPTLTGVPAAPQAAADTDTTQIATTSFVLGQVSTTTPAAIGVAAVGTSKKYARADHVHASSVLTGAPPVGTIIAWIGGYFTNGSNGSFTNVLGNTVNDANTYLNSNGWYVCNGSAVNNSSSPIFNGANRYLPNLTDSRFIQGYETAGAIGGSNAVTPTINSHTHSFSDSSTSGATTITTTSMPSHRHLGSGQTNFVGGGSTTAGITIGGGSYGTYSATYVGGGGDHDHTVSVSGTTGSTVATAVSQENRPTFLNAYFIMRVV